ncbi:hypothetical protein RD792_018037 [Penstemon davidsonii]|uniref:Uncharacterized protein n=1 Tax=Penstemon davidsonii TaxID=160366 RepID=A0ABR0DVD8_9LAMI|nr:hypothetical protein RD792_018037 [Penstemon davidsonii]
MFMWLPLGFILSIIRITIAVHWKSTQNTSKFQQFRLASKTKRKQSQRNLVLTYSLGRFSEIISPIKTVRLTRNREQDSKLIHEFLRRGDLVIFLEGTTCREPYSLRFSPLFVEISENISLVAKESYVAPAEMRVVMINEDGVEISKFEMANLVQSEIAKDLGFTCTKLTRKDKYLVLAGNEGTVKDGN